MLYPKDLRRKSLYALPEFIVDPSDIKKLSIDAPEVLTDFVRMFIFLLFG